MSNLCLAKIIASTLGFIDLHAKLPLHDVFLMHFRLGTFDHAFVSFLFVVFHCIRVNFLTGFVGFCLVSVWLLVGFGVVFRMSVSSNHSVWP